MASKITFSIEILKTKIGLLKLFEIILGAAIVGLIYDIWVPVEALYAFQAIEVCAVISLFCTSVLLLSSLLSPASANVLAKSFFELLLHGIIFVFYMSSSMAFLILTAQEADSFDNVITTAVLAVLNSILYFMSLFYSYKSFKD